MADIQITDNLDLSADLKIRDDSPLAKAGLTRLVATGKELFDDFSKPIDQADERSVTLGGTFTSPNLLSSDVSTLTVGAGMNCGLSLIKAADKLLFPDDGFSPVIPVAPNQAWLGVEFDLTGTATVGASVNGLGVSFEGTTKLGCSSYSLFTAAAPPLPLLRDACATAFGNFALTTSAAAIRTQLPNTVNVTDLSGSVTATVTLQQPFTLNALASANLPFNKTASIQPAVTLKLAPSLQITGDFLVRSCKLSEDVVRLGAYKKHGTTLSVSFTAGAGIGGDIGSDDVLGALLNAALPGVDIAAAGISGANAKTLNGVIKDALNRSLSAQVNATCSAALTDEAAVLYEIQLNKGDSAATDHALGLALHGDWTELEALSNVRRIRNIAVETVEKKRSLTVNLLGFYSATSVSDYLKSCTVLVDDSGQITITDKMDASRISASTSPYAADTNKLRQALMEDFLCTATYAVMAGKLNLNLAVVQSYLDYKADMPQDEMHENVLLGYALNLIPQGSLDATLKANPSFHHALVNAVVHYDMPALLDIFYKEPSSKTERSRSELEQVGREVMCMLLDPSDDTDAVRLSILQNDATWAQMDEIGNTAVFSTIPYLSHLGVTELGAVSADWVSIVWWAEALSKIAPSLTAAIGALAAASADDPTHDPGFMKARERLANVLGAVTRNTSAAFVHGWGEAVMFTLSARHGSGQMDIYWNSKSLQFGPPASS
ncbi:MAG: hypothetical protein ACYCO5_00525 [Acidobacteriaceae bacterium]